VSVPIRMLQMCYIDTGEKHIKVGVLNGAEVASVHLERDDNPRFARWFYDFCQALNRRGLDWLSTAIRVVLYYTVHWSLHVDGAGGGQTFNGGYYAIRGIGIIAFDVPEYLPGMPYGYEWRQHRIFKW
jgi:hypothetical protein